MALDLKTDESAVCWAPLQEYPGLSILSNVVSSSQVLPSSSSMQTGLTEAQLTKGIYNSNVALDMELDKRMHFLLIKMSERIGRITTNEPYIYSSLQEELAKVDWCSSCNSRINTAFEPMNVPGLRLQ